MPESQLDAHLRWFSVESPDAELAREEIQEVPLPGREWRRVLEMTNGALAEFTVRGFYGARSVKDCITSVSSALEALDNGEAQHALYHLQHAEVLLSRFGRRKVRAGPAIVPEETPVSYGCKLAVDHLKESVASCIRGVAGANGRELIRARISLEDATMSVLSAYQQAKN